MARVRAVTVHDPQIRCAVAVARKGNALSVRRKTRLHVERGAFGQPLRGTARHGHHVEISEKVEDDLRTVGAYVEVHPRAFGGLELERARGAESGVHVPGIILRVLLRGRGRGREQCDGNYGFHDQNPSARNTGSPSKNVMSTRVSLMFSGSMSNKLL